MPAENEVQAEQYDANGFDSDGRHRENGGMFHPVTHLTANGDSYHDYGWGQRDWRGCSPCMNGDCHDSDCETCNPSDDSDDDDESSFRDHLLGYSAKAPEVHGWRPKNWYERAMYAGHEIEMFSDDEDPDDVSLVLRQINRQYAALGPLTTTSLCAIAKRDGSLDDQQQGGFETVTVPLTAAQTYGIFKSFTTLGDGRCSAWTVGDDVGHHIHLTKAAIFPLTLGKLGVFMNAEPNRPFLERIAGRSASYNEFENRKKLTCPENAFRHAVLNITDYTVEFRLFKANLYSKAILKNYEFCMAAVRFCDEQPHGFGDVSEDGPLHWRQFCRFVAANRSQYEYLHEFMLTQAGIRLTYRRASGLPSNVSHPKPRSPKFALIQTGNPPRA